MNILDNKNYIELEKFYDDKTAMVVASVLVDDEIIVSKHKHYDYASHINTLREPLPFILTTGVPHIKSLKPLILRHFKDFLLP